MTLMLVLLFMMMNVCCIAPNVLYHIEGNLILFFMVGKKHLNYMHIEALGKSRKDVDDVVAAAEMRAKTILSESYRNKKEILDIPFQ